MKRSLVIVAVASLLAAALMVSAKVGAAPARPTGPSQFFSPPRELVLYGHIESLRRDGRQYLLRFDPAHWLGGVTANRAAVEDGVIQPGESVPNDYYIREDGHRLLTYRVPASARVTVLTRNASGFRSTRITVAELAQISRGRNPRGRPLADRRGFLGFWIRVAIDTVRSIDQQYQP